MADSFDEALRKHNELELEAAIAAWHDAEEYVRKAQEEKMVALNRLHEAQKKVYNLQHGVTHD